MSKGVNRMPYSYKPRRRTAKRKRRTYSLKKQLKRIGDKAAKKMAKEASKDIFEYLKGK